jgi:hypothetical protein
LHLDTGIRPLEALTLLPSDFNYRGREVTVKGGKRQDPGSVELSLLSDITAKAIKKLLETRPSKWNGESPVFANWEGNVMRVETWAQRVKELYAVRLGVSLSPTTCAMPLP